MIVLILIIILALVYRSHIDNYGIPTKITTGSSDASTDSFALTGNNIYIGTSSSALALTLSSGSSIKIGYKSCISNTSSKPLTLTTSTGSNISIINSTLNTGEKTEFIATSTSGSWQQIS